MDYDKMIERAKSLLRGDGRVRAARTAELLAIAEELLARVEQLEAELDEARSSACEDPRPGCDCCGCEYARGESC